ncbi:MAG: type VI secretion system baseplate subunit TssF, partial [Phycisphaeraceae bacterium]|nr:type VI secretion system baseplate subunit TssF [Phycisphaeraceae bacterium]
MVHGYFAFSGRFLYGGLGGLRKGLQRIDDTEAELVVLLDRIDPAMENAIDAEHFVPFVTPAINLFPKRSDRINLTERN